MLNVVKHLRRRLERDAWRIDLSFLRMTILIKENTHKLVMLNGVKYLRRNLPAFYIG